MSSIMHTSLDQVQLLALADRVKTRTKWTKYFGDAFDNGKVEAKAKLADNVFNVNEEYKDWLLALKKEIDYALDAIENDREEEIDASTHTIGLATYRVTNTWSSGADRRRWKEATIDDVVANVTKAAAARARGAA